MTPTQDTTAEAPLNAEEISPVVGSPLTQETLSTQLCPAAHLSGFEPLRLTLETVAPVKNTRGVVVAQKVHPFTTAKHTPYSC